MIAYQLHYQPGKARWLEFADPVASIIAHQPDQVLPALIELQRRVDSDRLCAAGWVSYGAAAGTDPALVTPKSSGPLLHFGLYDGVRYLPKLPAVFPGLGLAGGGHNPDEPITLEGFDPAAHAIAVDKIKQYLRSGDSYQVNYTQQLTGQWHAGSAALFRRLVAAQPQSYAAYLIETGGVENDGVENQRAICSVSPELFFQQQGDTVRCKPMKGTARRGRYGSEDRAAGLALQQSIKDQAENLMIVDMVRNDLGRIARTGTVQVERLFELEKYPTVWQLTSTITAQTGASIAQIFAALFPCASIIGAPKPRTMEIIEQLESGPRGLYTGAIGWLLPERQAQFNVAIRTTELTPRGEVKYGVGGGIVWDSDPQKEADECLDKARVLNKPLTRGVKLLETLRWTPGEGYWLLAGHLQRLRESADYFDYAIDIGEIKQHLIAAISQFSARPQRVRLTLSDQGEIELTHQPLLALASPVRVAIYPQALDGDEVLRFHKCDPRPWLGGIPTPAAAGVDDWLFTNRQGKLTESTIANLVVSCQGNWLTPPLTAGLLAGTYRQRLLDTGVIKEQEISSEMIANSQRIGLINSVRGWRSAILVKANF